MSSNHATTETSLPIGNRENRITNVKYILIECSRSGCIIKSSLMNNVCVITSDVNHHENKGCGANL